MNQRNRMLLAGAGIACAMALVPALAAGPTAPTAADRMESIRWSIDGARQQGKVELTVDSRWGANSRSSWSNDRPLSELSGLSSAQLAGRPAPVRFALVGDAGRIDCSGTAGDGRGNGWCTLSPDPAFASYLKARRMGTPTRYQAFSLIMSGVGRELVDALAASGFERPDVEQLTAMGIHGVTPDYVRALAGLGYRLAAEDVVAFKIHGVEPDYIRQLAAIGPALNHIRSSDLVSLRIHGVKPEFVQAMAAIEPEFRNVTAEDLVAMSIHGVRPELARSFVRLESGRLSSDDLVAMAIHGVTADYIEQLAALGYRNLAADQLVSLAIHGVTADYVRSLQSSGLGRLSAEQLVRLRTSGFDPSAR
jgi:hypothetical protein